MTEKKTTRRVQNRKVPVKRPADIVIKNSVYVDVTWHQEFIDQDDGALHNFEFKIPPAAISIGDFVEIAFSNDKGRVIDVRHYIRDDMYPGHTDKPHLRHFIRIKIETNAE